MPVSISFSFFPYGNRSHCLLFQAFLIAIACFFATSANAAHILGLFPLAARSHYGCNSAILKSLHAAGHRVTMVSPFPLETPLENFTNIDSGSATTAKFLGPITLESFVSLRLTETVELGIAMESQLCEDVMQLREIQVSFENAVRACSTPACHHLLKMKTAAFIFTGSPECDRKALRRRAIRASHIVRLLSSNS